MRSKRVIGVFAAALMVVGGVNFGCGEKKESSPVESTGIGSTTSAGVGAGVGTGDGTGTGAGTTASSTHVAGTTANDATTAGHATTQPAAHH